MPNLVEKYQSQVEPRLAVGGKRPHKRPQDLFSLEVRTLHAIRRTEHARRDLRANVSDLAEEQETRWRIPDDLFQTAGGRHVVPAGIKHPRLSQQQVFVVRKQGQSA